MTKCAFIPNFLRFYNLLWNTALPFLKQNQRLSPSFSRRTRADHLKKADIWIQAASAGEAFLAVSIVQTLCFNQKSKILVTTTTDQGMEILKAKLSKENLHPSVDLSLDWFPFDIPSTVETAVRRVNPQVMVLLETEIWPALLHNLKATPTLILNARLSNRSAKHYGWTRFLWKHLCPDRILAISGEDAKKYERVFQQTAVTTMKNIKFDILNNCSETSSPVKGTDMDHLLPNHLPLSILASVRRQEEPEIIQISKRLKEQFPNQIIAIFPRHMHRIQAMGNQLKKQGIPFVLRSAIKTPLTGPALILWDTFGELRSAYGHASTVFVGGSLKPLGGQNFIEPTALGIPTTIGPHWDDFTWVGQDIFSQKIVTQCLDWQEVCTTMVSHLNHPIDKTQLKEKASAYIDQHTGGTQEACRAIIEAM